MREIRRGNRLRRWSVTIVALLLGTTILAVIWAGYSGFDTPRRLQIGIPVLLALGVAAFGLCLARSEFDPASVARVARWSVGGAVVLGGFALFEVYAHILQGEPIVETLHELLLGLTIGAAVGAIAGYYDARRRDQYLEAEQARQAIAASMDGIAILDEDGRYVTVNQAHADVYGYDDPDAFVGETWRRCYTEDEIARVEEDVFPILDTEGSWRGKLTGKRRDGTTFPQELTLSSRPDGGLVCIVRDVTERQEYEERLRALNETGRELLTAETEAAVAEIVVEAAHRLLDQPITSMWSYDPDGDVLVPVADADPDRGLTETPDASKGLTPIHAGTREMEIFSGGETIEIEDYQELESPGVPGVPLGTLLVTPLGDHGILNVGSPDVTPFDPADRQPIEILARNAHAALERVERERTLAEREQRLETIIKNAPIILFAIDRNREITLQMGKGLDAVGVEQNQMVGASIDEQFEASPEIIDAVDRSLAGEPVDVGVDVWGRTYQVWFQPVASADGTSTVIGIAMDVTERRRRERGIRALHDATRRMMLETDREAICRIAVETAHEALDLPLSAVWLRADGEPRLEPVAWTDPVEDVIGDLPTFEPGESISWKAYEAGEARVFDDVSQVDARSNPETEMRSELVVPLGEFGVLNSGTTDPGQFDETDVILAKLLATNTRTALDRADREATLERQTDRMEFFNSILRHDVLNGMTVIRGRAQFLAEELEGEQLRDAEAIVEWTHDVTEVIRRVRTVLDTLTGTGEPDLEPVDLSAALRSELDRVRTTYPGVRVETEIPDGVTARANELVGEVLGNIVMNAIEHNDTEGLRISVSVEAERDGSDDPVTVRIADNGRGIPDADKDAIFRRDVTAEDSSSGSGFGLFFVDSMVAEYGGEIRVEDNDPQGAAFVMELPPAS